MLRLTGLWISGGGRRELARDDGQSYASTGWQARSAGQTVDDLSTTPMARRFERPHHRLNSPVFPQVKSGVVICYTFLFNYVAISDYLKKSIVFVFPVCKNKKSMFRVSHFRQ
jgi:hypothetical protein